MIFPDQGHRSVFPPDVQAQAIALACSLPKEKGVALSHWSLAEMVHYLFSIEVAVVVSLSTLYRWLSADKLKPWRYHNWQHILNPEKFLERARPVLEIYAHAAELLHKGIWAVCVDEKTSIQARQLDEEPVPAKSERPIHIAARYKRQGALQLFAGLSVADGVKYGKTSERKRFVDFQAFLSEIILPEAIRRSVNTLYLILDNGSTHAPKQLENWLQEYVNTNNWMLTVKVFWLPVNASWLDQIEIWFSILQRKLLTPSHFHSTQELDQSIMQFIRSENTLPKPIRWTYTTEKLEAKLKTKLGTQ